MSVILESGFPVVLFEQDSPGKDILAQFKVPYLEISTSQAEKSHENGLLLLPTNFTTKQISDQVLQVIRAQNTS